MSMGEKPSAVVDVVPAMSLYPTAIASDGTTVYWADPSTNSVSSGIDKCAASGCGGAPTNLTGAPAYDIAVDAASLYWTDARSFSVVKLTPK